MTGILSAVLATRAAKAPPPAPGRKR
jgi:hypothetical protein